jgi:hypothetical protein
MQAFSLYPYYENPVRLVFEDLLGDRGFKVITQSQMPDISLR